MILRSDASDVRSVLFKPWNNYKWFKYGVCLLGPKACNDVAGLKDTNLNISRIMFTWNNYKWFKYGELIEE